MMIDQDLDKDMDHDDIIESNNEREDKAGGLCKWRWLILLSFCILALSNGITYTGFTAISNILQVYYQVKAIQIHLLLGMFILVMVFFVFPFSYLLHRYELGCVLKVSAILNLIGGVIRYFGDSQEYGYYFLLVGNFFSALSMAGYKFTTPKLANNWFGVNEHGRVIGLGVGINMFASALGFIHSTQTVSNTKIIKDTKSDIKTLVLQQLIAAGVAMVIICVFSQSKPKTPPLELEEVRLNRRNSLDNITMEVTEETTTSDFLANIKLLLTNKQFLLIVHLASIASATEIFFSMILNDVLTGIFADKEKQIGIIGFVAIVMGFLSNITAGYIIDQTKAYKKMMFMSFTLSSICLITWSLFLTFYPSFHLLSLSFCSFIMVNASNVTTATSLMVVATQPLSPGSSCMVLLIFSSIYGSIISFTGSFVLQYTSNLFVSLIMISLEVIACILSLQLKKFK